MNSQLLEMYWSIGNTSLQQQAAEGWVSKVIDRLSDDLRQEFPEMRGPGRESLHFMRRFSAAWTREEIGRGFTFVERHVHFSVDGQNFFVALLFFHLQQLRYMVVELKVDQFRPRPCRPTRLLCRVVNDQLRDPALHAPTIGLLLCATRADAVVR